MAEIYGFFPDVLYGPDDFTGYFRDFYSNGIMGNNTQNLQVLAKSGLNLTVNPGICYIDGHFFKPQNETTIKIVQSDTEYPRTDLVVVRCDYINNKVSVGIITGTPSAIPVMPQFKRNTDAYDLVLAMINVKANASEITQADITDLRFNADYCGIVTGKINTINTTDLFAQYQAAWNDFIKSLGESDNVTIDTEDVKSRRMIKETRLRVNSSINIL